MPPAEFDRLDRLGSARHVDIGRRDQRPFGGEQHRRGASDPRAGAGDEADLVGEAHAQLLQCAGTANDSGSVAAGSLQATVGEPGVSSVDGTCPIRPDQRPRTHDHLDPASARRRSLGPERRFWLRRMSRRHHGRPRQHSRPYDGARPATGLSPSPATAPDLDAKPAAGGGVPLVAAPTSPMNGAMPPRTARPSIAAVNGAPLPGPLPQATPPGQMVPGTARPVNGGPQHGWDGAARAVPSTRPAEGAQEGRDTQGAAIAPQMGPPQQPPGDRGAQCTAPQLRRFIKSRPYVPMHELRRRFGIFGDDDDVTPVRIDPGCIFVGLPTREGDLLGDLLRTGEIGYELSLDPRTPIVIGVYPMRPIPRA